MEFSFQPLTLSSGWDSMFSFNRLSNTTTRLFIPDPFVQFFISTHKSIPLIFPIPSTQVSVMPTITKSSLSTKHFSSPIMTWRFLICACRHLHKIIFFQASFVSTHSTAVFQFFFQNGSLILLYAPSSVTCLFRKPRKVISFYLFWIRCSAACSSQLSPTALQPFWY